MSVLACKVVRRHGWTVYAYCLMPNHYHLVLETPADDLAAGMHLLNGRYARRFNVRHGRVGHVFQGPYGARPIADDDHLLRCCRYVVLNPVRAGLCRDPAAWRWSSYRVQIGLDEGPGLVDVRRIHALAGGPEGFRDYVLDGVDDCNLVETRLLPGQS